MTVLTRRSTLGLMAGVALAAPFRRRAHADDATVNVYNWADYIDPTVIDDFQAETGISVTYDTYASTEEMEAKMLAGQTGYDVTLMSGASMPIFNKAGIFDRLDRSRLPGFDKLDPDLLRLYGVWDPDTAHSLPYMWGSVGLAFNTDMVSERLPGADLHSLDILFKPDNAAKLADCGISLLDSPTDVVPLALKYLGIDPVTAGEADYRKVVELFQPIRASIRTFDNSNFRNALPNGEICVANSWSGDYATARALGVEAGVDVKLAYYVPKTGAPIWADCFTIPADAAHKDAAYAFLAYLLRPDIIARCTNVVAYANANRASRPMIKPEILNDPAIYPDAATMALLYTPVPPTPEQDRLLARIWAEIKAG